MSEEACSFFGVMSHQVLVSLKAIGVVAWGNHSIWMYPATSSKSRSVTSFACRALAPLHKDDTHQIYTGALDHGSRKAGALAHFAASGACGSQLHFGTSNVHVVSLGLL